MQLKAFLYSSLALLTSATESCWETPKSEVSNLCCETSDASPLKKDVKVVVDTMFPRKGSYYDEVHGCLEVARYGTASLNICNKNSPKVWADELYTIGGVINSECGGGGDVVGEKLPARSKEGHSAYDIVVRHS